MHQRSVRYKKSLKEEKWSISLESHKKSSLKCSNTFKNAQRENNHLHGMSLELEVYKYLKVSIGFANITMEVEENSKNEGE